MSVLVLQSSWWGRESWLLCLVCLPGVSWWLGGSSTRCQGVVCSLWLWYFLIILTIFEFDWPSGFRWDVWKFWRTDDGVTGILLAHPWAFGSGELIMICKVLKISNFGLNGFVFNNANFSKMTRYIHLKFNLCTKALCINLKMAITHFRPGTSVLIRGAFGMFLAWHYNFTMCW